MRRPQFRLRTMLWMTLVVALLAAWLSDRSRLSTKLDAELRHRALLETDLQTHKTDLEASQAESDMYRRLYFQRMQSPAPRISVPQGDRRHPAAGDGTR